MKRQETTIKLKRKTKSRLDNLKEHPRESYDEVLNKTLNIINITIKNPVAGAKILRNIKLKKSTKTQVYQNIQDHTEEQPQKTIPKPMKTRRPTSSA